MTSSASVVAPNEADRKPENVTPICPAERKRLGSATRRATVAPRRLRAASPWTWLSRRDTSDISAAANTPPQTMSANTTATLSAISLTR